MDVPKYPSTPHTRFSLTTHRDDSYHEDESIFLDREVVITEKLDGGNTALFRGEVYARSVMSPSRDGWMAMVRKWHAYKTIHHPDLIFNGEDLYGVHSIQYDPIPENETFRLFSVRTVGDVNRLSWNETEYYARLLDFKLVPVLFRGKFKNLFSIRDWFVNNLSLPSSVGGPREGFVLRVVDGFPDKEWAKWSMKFVRPNHVQTTEHWRKDWKPCPILPPSEP